MQKYHYWCYKEITSFDNIYKTYADFDSALKKMNVILLLDKYDDIGLYRAIINTNIISFNNINGSFKSNDTFTFDFNKTTHESKCKIDDSETKYNEIVSLAILCIANNIPEFCFWSDLTFDDWEPVFKLYEKLVKPIKINEYQMIFKN
jgi:hypothetical protein